jgi:heptose-I-phosphate ethanolaminephosphotransferase
MTNIKIIKLISYQFLIIVLAALFFELLFTGLTLVTVYNTIENIIFSTVLISPFLLVSCRKIQTVYITAAYLMFSLSIYFETIYYYFFEAFLSASSLFVLFDSNRTEATEFLNFYLDINIVVFSVLMFLIISISIFKFKTNLRSFKKQSKRPIVKVLFYVVISIAFLKFSKLIIYNFPYLILRSSVKYSVESKILGTYKTNATGNFSNVSRLETNEDEVYVIVLGESSSRAHFGLYDYYRATTPNLNALKNELQVYNDVISPHPHSISSITKLLTLGNFEHPDKIGEGSIIQLANKTGFETFWLSNQRPIGIYESMVTKIALSSTKSKFLTTVHGVQNKVMDEKILPELEAFFKDDSSSKKLIIVHLMGTHLSYANRYPENFNVFKDEPFSNYKSEEISKIINDYDNAIRYSDYVISQIIEKTKALNKKSFVLYFSDHGEELYKDFNMAGHNEDISTKDMYDVPFVLWQSDKFKQQKQLTIDLDRPYMLDDLFHSLADLLDISAQEVEEERSLFSAKFKNRKRIILKNSEYDTYFN